MALAAEESFRSTSVHSEKQVFSGDDPSPTKKFSILLMLCMARQAPLAFQIHAQAPGASLDDTTIFDA